MVIYYDYKYQKIPLWILTINYILICCLADWRLLFGLPILFFCAYTGKPVDLLYVFLMVYLIIRVHSIWSIIPILFILVYALSGKRSFMVPLEIGIFTELIIWRLL